jgi:TRAP-type transport system periplasmic protein
MKKIFALLLTIALVCALFLTGCTTTTPTATAKAPSITTQSSAATQTIPLKFAYHTNPQDDITVMALEPFARSIEKATNNKVKITSYPNGTLAPPQDALDATINGVTDIAWVFTGMNPGRLPLTDLMALPYLGITDSIMGSLCFQHLYDTMPEFKSEYSKVKLLVAEVDYPTPVGTKGKMVTKLEDLKGLRLRVPGGPPTTWFKAAGAVPMNVVPADIYNNLEKGVIDGYNMAYSGVVGNSLFDVCKNVVEAKFNCSTLVIAMNIDKWNSLPPDVRAGIESVSGVVGAKSLGDGTNRATENCKKMMQGKGVQIAPLSSDEMLRWVNLAKPIANDLAAGLDAKGLAGSKTLNEIYKFISEYK